MAQSVDSQNTKDHSHCYGSIGSPAASGIREKGACAVIIRFFYRQSAMQLNSVGNNARS